MRLVLVDNLLLADKGDVTSLDVHPHLGLMSLIAVAESGGHEAVLFDPKRAVLDGRVPYDATLYQHIAQEIVALAPDVVGFTTLGCSFIVVTRVAIHLRQMSPDLPILLGGPHATILHREILECFDCFDVVVRHEAENTLLPVLAVLSTRRFYHIEGVTWRDQGSVRSTVGVPTVTNLDELPLPAYDRYDIPALGLRSIRVDAGRGCPFHCTFCSTASFFGRRFRLKSPERLLHELDTLHERYGFRDFKLNHDLFTVSKQKVRAFCNAVRNRGYTWGCSARVDCVDPELLELMYLSGCRGIYFGIEAGSPRMQLISEKKLDLDLVSPICDVTERLGIYTVVSFITGYPEEEQADQDATLDMIGAAFLRDRRYFSTQLHMLTPEPGTALYRQYASQLAYDGYVSDFNFETLGPEDVTLMRTYPDLFITHHYFPTVLPRTQHVFVVEAHRVLRSAGHDIMGYALRFYEGRLGVMMRTLYTWALANARSEVMDHALIVDFIAAHYGRDHHLVSLFRYAYGTASAVRVQRELRRVADDYACPSTPSIHYCLSPLAYIFSDIHDCAAILRIIGTDRQSRYVLSDVDVGERVSLVAVAEGTEEGALQNYVISPETEAILHLFRTPTSYQQLCRRLSKITGGVFPDWEEIAKLVEFRILLPAGHAAAAEVNAEMEALAH